MSLSPGATLGPYAIRAELGHGGMGVVYTAQDPRLDRDMPRSLRITTNTAGSRPNPAQEGSGDHRWQLLRPWRNVTAC